MNSIATASIFRSLNPATGVAFACYPTIDAAALERKLAAAATASSEWALSIVARRSAVLQAIAAHLRAEQDDLARMVVAEMGKTYAAASAEIEKCAMSCAFYAEHGPRYLQDIAVPLPSGSGAIRLRPLGLILAVMPWNFPFWQAFRFIAPALMGGNAILLKHAPNVPQSALAIERIVRTAGAASGMPAATMTNLFVDTPAIAGVIADDRVVAVTLTGSERAGQAVAEQAGRALKKCVLELGGSDPFIVMQSAALNAAVSAAVTARMQNNGQSCVCAKRFIIHGSLYDQFERDFVARVGTLAVGDPMVPNVQIGPLCTDAARARLHDQVMRAQQAGGRVLVGGESVEGPGFFYAPTVIAGLPRESAIAREEFFGPVALLFEVGSRAEALALANAVPFGLGSSVWTKDQVEAEYFIDRLECGITAINTIVASDPRLPFGGVKKSGYGRELSDLGLREFVNIKTILRA